MSRVFVSASSQYLEITDSSVDAAPMTISAWFQVDDTTASAKTIVDLSASGADDHIEFYSQNTGLYTYIEEDGVVGFSLGALASLAVDTWYHGVFRSVASNDHAVFVDGVSIDGDGTTAAPPGINTISIGRKATTAPGDYMNGKIAEVSFWDSALTDPQIAALAAGNSPMSLSVTPTRYWRFKANGDLTDLVSGAVLTNNGSTFDSDHPAVADPPSGPMMLLGVG